MSRAESREQRMNRLVLPVVACIFLTLVGCDEPATSPWMGEQIPIPTPAPQTESLSERGGLLRVDYEGFTLWLDCERRSAVRFEYEAFEDTGNHKRHSRFYFDDNIPKRCQQTSTKSYKGESERRYYRGHLFPANHGDSSKLTIKQSNFITNVLPQASSMNRGAWLHTEETIECYRNLEPLHVIGGALWEQEMPDSFPSHGLPEIPSHFWKVILRRKRAIAWIIPNSSEAKRKAIDDYLVSIQEIEQRAGLVIPTEPYLKEVPLEASWVIPKACDKS